MLFSLGHGQRIVVTPPSDRDAPSGRRGPGLATAAAKDERAPSVPLAAVAPAPKRAGRRGGTGPSTARADADLPMAHGRFAYLFPDAAGPADDPDIIPKLSALADAMVETEQQRTAPELDSALPPIMTYFGQFVDHDITANTDRDVASSQISGPDISPLPRSQVKSEIVNLRKGAPELDSVYGDGPAQDDFAKKLEGAMRHSSFKGKMRLDTAIDIGGRPTLPADPAVDLLRLGRLMDNGIVTQADLDALSPAMKDGFVHPDGSPLRQKAIIGDGRNDENLIVAQLQVAFLRLHNKVVDWVAGQSGAPTDSDGLFEAARDLVRHHYQWLVVNAFLPAVCDPAMVDEVKAASAPLYSAFFDANAPSDPQLMPLPLEFSVSAFRYGHTMVRGDYDYNLSFGREEDGTDNGNRADFDLLFFFTGRTSGGHDPLFGEDRLPSNWVADWSRLAKDAPDFPDRTARKIDTLLCPPLKDMLNEPSGVFKHLAERNLRRGHRLNIPTAQGCLDAVDGVYSQTRRLTEDELCSGATGAAVRDGGFVDATPLWFYVLKEAEVLGDGEHLGPLGSRIVADTLVGLCVKDPSSYWNASGSDNGRWHPNDGAKPDGHVIDDFEAMLKATGQL